MVKVTGDEGMEGYLKEASSWTSSSKVSQWGLIEIALDQKKKAVFSVE